MLFADAGKNEPCLIEEISTGVKDLKLFKMNQAEVCIRLDNFLIFFSLFYFFYISQCLEDSYEERSK